MRGFIISYGIILSTLLWADLSNIFVWTLIFVSLSLGGLAIMIFKNEIKEFSGLKSRYKFWTNYNWSNYTFYFN